MSVVTDFFGASDSKGAKDLMGMGKEGMGYIKDITKDQLEYMRGEYEDWKSIYGELQEDIGTYYKNLTGDDLVGPQKEAMQAAGQKASRKITEQMAQRGITNSGLEFDLQNENIFRTELAKANLEANKETLANTEKMKFLNMGLPQQQTLIGAQNDITRTAVSGVSGISSSAISGGTSLQKANQDASGGLLGLGLAAIGL